MTAVIVFADVIGDGEDSGEGSGSAAHKHQQQCPLCSWSFVSASKACITIEHVVRLSRERFAARAAHGDTHW